MPSTVRLVVYGGNIGRRGFDRHDMSLLLSAVFEGRDEFDNYSRGNGNLLHYDYKSSEKRLRSKGMYD